MIFNVVGKLLKPLFKGIDSISTTDEERMELKNKLTSIQNDLASKMIELEGKKIDAQSKIIVSESGSKFWLAANWRPLMMVSFNIIILWYAMTGTLSAIPEQMWYLMGTGITGYAGGRSAEKIMRLYKQK